MPKRTHGVITAVSPCTIKVNRVEYAADVVPGASVGTVVTFEPGERATGVEVVKAARNPERYARYAGIVVGRLQGGGFDLRSLPELEQFFRERDDDDLEIGDHLLFEVMSSDHAAWNLVTRRDAEQNRSLEVEDDDEDVWRQEREWLETL